MILNHMCYQRIGLTICCQLCLISMLTHWGRVTHLCISKQTIIGSDNDLSPGRRQAIIWTNAGILLIGTLGTNFSEILIKIRIFSFKKMGLNVSSAKWRPFCLGLNVLSDMALSASCIDHWSLPTLLVVMKLWCNMNLERWLHDLN